MRSNQFFKIALLGVTVFFSSCKDQVFTDIANPSADATARKGAGGGVSVSVSSLPASIVTYVSTNYASATIVKAEKYAAKYEVTLSSLIKLEFTLDGKFIEVSGGGNKGGGSKGGGGADDGNHVDPASLPAAITTYISTNYPGTTITKAEKSATEYEVRLSNGVKLEFNLDGTFKEISGGRRGADDPIITLPAAITSYISTNYPSATITKAEKSATGYEVRLSNGLKLEFNLDGTFRQISGSKG